MELEVYADAARIEQIIVNFINNAIKYAPESKEIRINIEKVNDTAKISVGDKGPGIPPEQVVGSSGVTKFQLRPDGTVVLLKEAKLEFVDDGPGKPAGINRFIGRRPIAAFGNSDGDQQMLEWTAAGSGPRFMGIVHHTDAEREYAYDRASAIGKLDKAWDEAAKRGWLVVDMRQDWRVIYPFENQ